MRDWHSKFSPHFANALGTSAIVKRSGVFDATRIFAMVWVVLYHTIKRPPYGQIPVDIFLAISLMLLTIRPASAYARAWRLLLPWALWGLVFTITGIVSGHRFDPASLLYGGSIHLWFLPYLLVWSQAAPWLLNEVRSPLLWCVIGWCLCASVTLALSLYHVPFPLWHWIVVLPGIAFAMVCCLTFQERGRGVVYLMLAAVPLMGLVIVTHNIWKLESIVAVTSAGACLILALMFLLPDFESPRWLRQSNEYTYGIYLMHPLIFISLRSQPLDIAAPIALLGTFILSVSVIYAVAKIPPGNAFRGSRALLRLMAGLHA